MSEKFPSAGPKKENVEDAQEQWYRELEEHYIKDRTTPEVIQLTPEECADKIEELEGLFTAFEQQHALEALHAIQVHSVEEARANEVRQAARRDVVACVSLLNLLEGQQAVPEEIFLAFHRRNKGIQAAIGTLNGGKLDHSVQEGWVRQS